MEYHPRFAQLIEAKSIHRVQIEMGRFGGNSMKPSWLYSGHQFISELRDYQDKYGSSRGPKRVLVNHSVGADGRRNVTGNNNLKQSQAYPVGFGRALADLFTAHQASPDKTH